MQYSFSGQSRKPRQVNLSGRAPANVFAAAGASVQSSVPAGSQRALLQAQQDRQIRQRERQRTNAARLVQRTWRGYLARHQLAIACRSEWDMLQDIDGIWDTGDEPHLDPQPFGTAVELHKQLRLLSFFLNLRIKGDQRRLLWFSQRFAATRNTILQECRHIGPSTLRGYQTCLLDALKLDTSNTPLVNWQSVLLDNLTRLFPHVPVSTYADADRIFTLFAELLPRLQQSEGLSSLLSLITAIKAALRLRNNLFNVAFAFSIMVLPEFSDERVADAIWADLDYPFFCSTLTGLDWESINFEITYSLNMERSCWLLANFIRRSTLEAEQRLEDDLAVFYSVLIITALLGSTADEISRRLKTVDTTMNDFDHHETANGHLEPLPDFIIAQLEALMDQKAFTRLFRCVSRLNTKLEYAFALRKRVQSEASILATYALTLSSIFPRRANEIRMWFQLGYDPTDGKDGSSAPLPAVIYFWQAAQRTLIFQHVSQNPGAVIDILGSHAATHAARYGQTLRDFNEQWSIILLFMSLYSFLLKVMDDDEFFSRTSPLADTSSSISNIRRSALSLSDVKALTVFLKHFAFAIYWQAQELSGMHALTEGVSISGYFRAKASDLLQPASHEPREIGGVKGISLEFVKGEVTGLLRMLYERDSRRPFLPKGHWLMTKYVDMAGFISTVLLEETEHVQAQDEDQDQGIESESDDEDSSRRLGLVGTGQTMRTVQLEKIRRRQARLAKRRLLEALTPRLEILQNMPFFIPFDTRVEIFRRFTMLDQARRRNGHLDPNHWRMSLTSPFGFGSQGTDGAHDIMKRQHARVRREHLLEDAFEEFYPIGDHLKEPIQITFIDKFDTEEAGIDGGGVTKEFLTSITKDTFTNENGRDFFVANDQNLLYPNPAIIDEREDLLTAMGYNRNSPEWIQMIRDLLQRYEFLGRIIGKCLYEGILVDVAFAGFFLLKWSLTGGDRNASKESSYRANINDLRDLDEQLYEGLLKLKNYPGDVEDFDLTFTIDDTITASGAGGPTRTITRDLVRNGSQIPVTNQNKFMYIQHVAQHRLRIQSARQTNAFLQGLSAIIQPNWLAMFNQAELQTLLGGASAEIDVSDLRKNTVYGGLYTMSDDGEEHPCIKLFWRVMEGFSDPERRKVLKFVTSTPRAPLLGFSQLQPRFSIRDGGDDEEWLPSTSTCVNLLKLPRYSEEGLLREKLLYAINADAGFDLS